MTRLQAIEGALVSINQAAFQELCDSFLALRNRNYSAFSRIGSQSGKQKTIKGTPDTFFMLPNGNYIFVEYSTNVTAGLSKLHEDIRKCIDEKRTGIPLNQIVEIILCMNFNLTAEEVQSLFNLLTEKNISLTIYTLDALSIELNLHHRDLTHQYLGLPLDTGQIVSIDNFIIEYNKASQGIATPLNNTFLHREEEIKLLIDSIHNYDFIIITGAAGVGKTKLSLEGIIKFLSNNHSFSAYCVSYKSHNTLLEDLYHYIEDDRDYILFVDDANRIDAFNQITGYFKTARSGKLKVVLTVRDYAYKEIGILCQELIYKRIDIFKLSDNQIIDIIKTEPFEILNPDYQKEIVRIADGNPRLAIMTALLAKAEQNIYALYDVSDLFERYFSTFIRDDGEFANELNIKCLGVIAFFYTIPYKERNTTDSILNAFGITYPDFIESIDKLDKLELVEIKYDYVKIPEQNLSTFFFYKAFIKDGLLSFITLLSKYFSSNNERFRECIIPANNTFGHQNVMDKLQPVLQEYWLSINKDEERAFKFCNTFWFYLQTEALEFVYNIVASLPKASISEYTVDYDNNAFSSNQNKIIELLGEFFRFPIHLKDSLELAFEYTRKKPEHLPELIHKIRERLTFDVDDERNRFQRQNILFQILHEGLVNDDVLYSTTFFELSKTFMCFKFQHTKGGRKHSFYWYDYPIPNSPVIQEFRGRIWDSLETYFERYPDYAFNLLRSYASVSPNATKDIMEYDLNFLIKIIDNKLNVNSFEHCRYVQDQIMWCKRNAITNESFSSLSMRFRNPTYEVFLKIDWNKLRDRDELEYDFKSYREYEKLKEEEIRSFFAFKTIADVSRFYDTFYYLFNATERNWNYLTSLDIIIDENCSINFDIGCLILQEIINKGNAIQYIPRLVLHNHLNTSEKADRIWNIIQSEGYNNVLQWQLSFFDNLNESLINPAIVDALINTIKNLSDRVIIQFKRLEKYEIVEPKLFQILLRAIVERNEQEGIQIEIWIDVFDTYFTKLGEDVELIKKAYLQQEKIHSSFDLYGKGFVNILRKDSNFLIEFVRSLHSKTFGLPNGTKDLSFVWQIDEVESLLMEVFDFATENHHYYGILEHFCNSFFRGLQAETKERAHAFLIEYCMRNFEDYRKINIVVDIARHTMSEIFEEVLLLYISLNQNVEDFSKILWRGSGTSGSGDVILADIEMADWKRIQSIVEKSDIGIKLLPIKKYLIDRIELCHRYGDWERQRRFLEQY